jgi:hypothetical protein
MSQIPEPGARPMLSPEARELGEHCVRLSAELADLFAEETHLAQVVIPNIAAMYAARIGPHECAQVRLEIEVRRLRRVLEGIRTIENRGGAANAEQVEAAVEEELAEWNRKLRDMAESVRFGRERLDRLMPEADAAGLRRLYRDLVRALHPDVNPEYAARHKALWARVQEAYAAGNVEELRALTLALEDPPAPSDAPNALDMLRARRDRLRENVRSALERIQAIRNSPPFETLAKLEDHAWVEQKTAGCDRRIAELQTQAATLSLCLEAWKKARG